MCITAVNNLFVPNRNVPDSHLHAITEIFKKTLLEYATIRALVTITAACAISSAAVDTLIVFGTAVLVTNLISRILHRSNPLPPLLFSLFFQATAGVLIHECGHATAIHLLFQKTQLKIQWTGLFCGLTSTSTHGLTLLGRVFGPYGSIFLVIAAGPLAGVLTGTALIVAGLWLNSPYCKMTGSAAIVHHVLYALTALNEPASNISHDFVGLWAFGIHPIAAAVAIAALPLLATRKWQAVN